MVEKKGLIRKGWFGKVLAPSWTMGFLEDMGHGV